MSVDLHCHVLPGLDDGARDLDDALAMLRQAQGDGIGAICATPHIRHDHDVHIGELAARVSEVAAAGRAAGCRTRVLQGGEVAAPIIHDLDDDELRAVSLGGFGRWILLEPAPGPLDAGLDEAVHSLRARGFRSLIAHPERHLGPDLIGRLARLVADGALIQATAAYLTDETTRSGMLELAAAGVIHVLGSDAHSSSVGRPVALAGALAVLGEAGRIEPHLDWIGRVAPHAIVAGLELASPFAAGP